MTAKVIGIGGAILDQVLPVSEAYLKTIPGDKRTALIFPDERAAKANPLNAQIVRSVLITESRYRKIIF